MTDKARTQRVEHEFPLSLSASILAYSFCHKMIKFLASLKPVQFIKYQQKIDTFLMKTGFDGSNYMDKHIFWKEDHQQNKIKQAEPNNAYNFSRSSAATCYCRIWASRTAVASSPTTSAYHLRCCGITPWVAHRVRA
ncbi:hypothetical protein [Acetobacter okinawensis]|uniref:hypothetical protein n=1 Tax=Acetobacter okinawensis TaxID=1076594 RepID=UPI0031452B7E